MIQNVGPTDAMFQIKMTFTGGTTPAISAGSFSFAFNYVLRNPDGSWYPVTPPVPYANPAGSTY